MTLTIREAGVRELPVVHRIMREAFEEYRGKLHPEPSALRETVTDTAAKVESGGGAVIAWEDPDKSDGWYTMNKPL